MYIINTLQIPLFYSSLASLGFWTLTTFLSLSPPHGLKKRWWVIDTTVQKQFFVPISKGRIKHTHTHGYTYEGSFYFDANFAARTAAVFICITLHLPYVRIYSSSSGICLSRSSTRRSNNYCAMQENKFRKKSCNQLSVCMHWVCKTNFTSLWYWLIKIKLERSNMHVYYVHIRVQSNSTWYTSSVLNRRSDYDTTLICLIRVKKTHLSSFCALMSAWINHSTFVPTRYCTYTLANSYKALQRKIGKKEAQVEGLKSLFTMVCCTFPFPPSN